MDNLTHSLFALTLARSGLLKPRRGLVATLLLASNAPDVDIMTVARGNVSYLAGHRGPTHGVLGIIGLAATVTGILRLTHRSESTEWVRRIFGVALVGVVLHVLMDLPTSYGTRLFSPFSGTWYAADWLPIIDVYLLAILAAGLLLMRFTSVPAARIATVVLLLMGTNYVARAAAHSVAITLRGARDSAWVDHWSAETPGRTRIAAIPTFISPFRWRLVRRLPEGYELSDVDLLQMFRAQRGAPIRSPKTWFPDQETNPWVARARETRTARVFLEFSRFPAARVLAQTGELVTVRWDDMRFVGGFARGAGDDRPWRRSPFSVLVHLSPDGRVLSERLGD
jgi:membrane-bound metal-dependent hydrolase YbcI (DUF457 family)